MSHPTKGRIVPPSLRDALQAALVVARMYEAAGDLPAALAAVRRRVFGFSWSPMYVQYHAMEGRLAAMTGDREGAILA